MRSVRVAWLLAGLTLVLVVADAVVTAQYRSLLSEAAVAVHGFPFVNGAVLGCTVMGALVLSSDARHPIGWLLNVVGFTSAVSLLCESYGLWVLTEGGPGPAALAGVAGWLSGLLGGQFAIAGLALMFLLAPDGHFVSRRWRYAAWVIEVGAGLCLVAIGTVDPTTFPSPADAQALGPARALVLSIGFLLISLGLLASLVSMLVRLRRSEGEQRQQVRLIALAATLVSFGVIGLLGVQAVNGGRQTWAASLPLFAAYLLLPILLAVAVLRYRLYDIEVIVNRSVVLAVATAFAGIGYTTLVVAAGSLVDRRTGGFWLSLLATALVALAFQPLRRWVTRLANRLAFGSRARPYEALSDFSRRLAETPSPSTLLEVVAEASGRAVAARRATASLEMPGVAAVTASWGPGDPDVADGTVGHLVHVRAGGVTLGRIEVLVPKARPVRDSDDRLLQDLAEQAAVAFRNLSLEVRLAEHVAELDRTTEELARSRLRIIEADDAARRALEAAISREVLPHLVALPGELARSRAAVAAGEPANGLDLLVEGTNAALESLRELTRGVFPTQLTRAGIEPALRSWLARIGLGSALHVAPSAAGQRFSARVEAAVYFCCVEAARAVPGPPAIELSTEGDDLVVLMAGGSRAGVDLQAMVDRVTAVGGSLTTGEDLLALRIPVGPPLPGDPHPLLVGRAPGR